MTESGTGAGTGAGTGGTSGISGASGGTTWQVATVASVAHEPAGGVRLRLDVPERATHDPGQHYVVRLTADDGYRAQRSYSVASAPGDPLLELWVDRLPDGEVSTFLADELRVGDALEVRGPIGRFFVWDGSARALCVGGGTGVVPFVAMVRSAQASGAQDRLAVVAAGRALPSLPYGPELLAAGAHLVLSRQAYGGRDPGRLRADDLAPLLDDREVVFVCGSAAFAEAASQLLVQLEVPVDRVRVERFGPSG